MIEDSDYIAICKIIANKSHAIRNKVGALIVKDGNIISFGYNGTPRDLDNICERSTGETLPEVLHAESNAILKCATSNTSSDGATLYTLLAPCFECAKLIIQAKIVRVVYLEKYRNPEGLYLLRKAKIRTTKII